MSTGNTFCPVCPTENAAHSERRAVLLVVSVQPRDGSWIIGAYRYCPYRRARLAAARVLISIATDESAKRTERIAAAKELNVLYGITIIDEKGNTRRSGVTLDELLKMTPSANADAHKVH
ncbi:TPA: hypothetical protein SAP13_004713 [Burkholderia multivorans]|nr:hypothetical protein [Burkholderia multivorans]